MRSFRVFFLLISMAFVVASCGSSTTTTAAVSGIAMANEVQVL